MVIAAEGYFYLLNAMIVVTALIVLISGLDDLFIDVYFWSKELYRILIRRQPSPVVTAQELRDKEERYFAIMVPAWQEADVIAHMIENTLQTLEYDKYVVFLGTYQNDAKTTAEAERMVGFDPRHVVRAPVLRNGPTCKADCLNWILRAMAKYEAEHKMQFAGVLMHDCEDVIHPMELKYFNARIDDADLIQLPVMSLELKWPSWVAGAYMDDFSEVHQKDIIVREQLTGLVPGAGVALCYSRRAIQTMMDGHDGQPFNTSSLTEDYDFSFRMGKLGMKQTFARYPLQHTPVLRAGLWWRRPATASGLLATCEYFPSEFVAAYRQRARWVLGISFLGWRQLGWQGDFWTKYMFVRDRKGILTAPFSILAYFVLANTLAVTSLDGTPPLDHGAERLVVFAAWLRPILIVNFALLFNRLCQRVYFVTRLNGLQQGLMSVPRIVFTNFINFAAVFRAWHQYLRHLATGVPIAWDKTQHTFPTTAELAHNRRLLGDLLVERGLITAEHLGLALDRHRASGVRLGQVLLEDGLLTPQALADVVAEQAGFPRIPADSAPQLSLAKSISRNVIRDHQVVPFAMASDNTLQVAVAATPGAAAAKAIRESCAYRVTYVVACDHEVAAWAADLAQDEGPESTNR